MKSADSEAGTEGRSSSSLVTDGASGGGARESSEERAFPMDDRSEARELYFALSLTRAAEERLAVLEDEGRLPLAPLRLPFREGAAVAAAFALRRGDGRPRDILVPTRRAAGALRMFGIDLTAFFRDHLEGRVGSVHGRSTELHRVDLEAGLLAPVAPLGILVEVMAGITLAFRLRGEDRVGVVFDSGAATSTGAWHEGVVFAAARRCPLVLVIEAAPTDRDRPRPRDTRVGSFTEKGPGYGAETVSVDSMDVLAVVEAVVVAAERARRGGGVQIVEVRYPDEDAAAEAADPLARLRSTLIERGSATADELDELDQEAARAAADAARRAIEEAASEEPHDDRPLYAGHDRTRPRRTWASPQVSA